MCYNFDISLNTWFFVLFLCIYMILNYQQYTLWIPIFTLIYTQIQLLEAILWANIKNLEINEKTTKYISYLLWAQPLANFILAYNYSKNVDLIKYIIIYSFINIYNYTSAQSDTFISTIGENGHLVWNRINNSHNISILGNNLFNIIYLYGMLVPFLYMDSNEKYIPLSIGILTFFNTITKYNKEFGSMWCYHATILPLASIMLKNIS